MRNASCHLKGKQCEHLWMVPYTRVSCEPTETQKRQQKPTAIDLLEEPAEKTENT